MLYEVIVCAGMIGLLVFLLEKRGERAAQNEQMKRALDDIHTAALARDRLHSDADDAKRVRDRFTRELL